jgi:sulfite reductase (NADPH) flavoprotein alpha-component
MTARQIFSEGALTLEQWQLVEQLGSTLSPAQARWISGYFAGLDAGLMRARSPAGTPTPVLGSSARTLTILYGTETGNSRDLGKALAAAASARGLAPQVYDMSDYKMRSLKDEQDVLVIVSTYGEGDPPQPSVGFFEFLEGKRAPKLDNVRFSVLALGDSTYEKYCEAGRRIDSRLEELGARRIHDRVDCDIDYEDQAEAWSRSVVDLFAADLAAGSAPSTVPAVPAPPAVSDYDKKNPFHATVLENDTIVGRHSTKETRHIELDLSGSELSYEPGDALGIAASNDPAVVAQLLAAAGLSADSPVTVKGETLPLSEALEKKFEVSIASPRFIDQWATLTGAAELDRLRQEEYKAERMVFLHQHHVVDIVRRFPLSGLDPESLLAGLRPLQPRLYSIASSLAAVSGEAHITVAPVRYELHEAPRAGVASSQLADRVEVGDTVPVYIQHNPHFSLPKANAPIIMIGAGTGVAPYRGFLQEREVTGEGGKSWLFFGERTFRSDFLYQVEWQQWLKNGVLSRMDVAFSRDPGQPKSYVQHRMLEQAKDIYAWLEEGAHIYVCGDEKSMAKDVHETLIRVVSDQGRVDRDTAEAFVRGLATDHRYQRDVY